MGSYGLSNLECRIPIKDWTIGALARAPLGRKTYPSDPEACQWCGLGALIYATDTSGDMQKDDALRIRAGALLDEAAGEVTSEALSQNLLHGSRPLPFLNDGPDGHARVLKAYDLAIAKAREKEASS